MLSIIIPVYRNATSALRLIDALAKQVLPPGQTLEVIAVDDGSGDGTPDRLSAANYSFLKVLTLEHNSGRSHARNTGALHARGEYLFFIDCDCLPEEDHFLAKHLQALENGASACCGPLIAGGTAFWNRYQNEASLRRTNQYTNGIPYAGTTANFSIKSEVFRKLGGFDARYIYYGFEDRDLLVRLSSIGQINWCTTAIIRHLDKITLPDITCKLRQAGRFSSALFSDDHPAAYRTLGYASIDARLHPWLCIPGRLLEPLLNHASAIETLIEKRWFPYTAGRLLVKLVSALAFLHGSMANNTAPSDSQPRSMR